jgi:hypothetical protein
MLTISIGEYCLLTKIFFCKRHNTEVDGRMHSGETKITDLIREYLQTKEKIRVKGGG